MLRVIAMTAALGAAVLGTATPALSRPATASLPALEISYRRHVLSNGLTLIVHEDRFAPLVSVSAWYHVGGKDEPVGRGGFAHLFEHLNFPPNHKGVLTNVGATADNAHTRNDYTNYFQTVPATALDTALWIEARRMGQMPEHYNQRKLDAEREIVEGEKRFVASRFPYAALETEVLWKETYPAVHPYSRSGMGSSEDLNAATLDDVRQWHERWQGAANAVLVVAGDVSSAEVLRKVEQYFGGFSSGPPVTRVSQWVAKMSGERRVTATRREVPDARFYKVWNVPGYATRDFTMLELATQILGDGPNSRLRRRLMTSERLASEVRVRLEPMELGSQVRISVALNDPEQLGAAELALNDELTAFLREGPTREELDQARVSLYSRLATSLERLDAGGGKSWYLAVGEMYAGSPGFYSQALTWQQAATPEDVRLSAQQWLSDGAFVLAVRPEPKYSVAASAADLKTAPAAVAPPALALPALQRATLSNGLKVAVMKRDNAALTRLSLLVDGGDAADAPGRAGTSRLALRVLKEYAQTLNSKLSGARIDESTTLDSSALSITTIASHFPESVALLRKALHAGSWRAQDLREAKDAFAAIAAQQERQPAQLALQAIAQAISGGNAAYESAMANRFDASALQSLGLDELRHQQRPWLRPDNATLLIVGASSLSEAMPVLEKQLGSWRVPKEANSSLDQHHGSERASSGVSQLPEQRLGSKPALAEANSALDTRRRSAQAADDSSSRLLGVRAPKRGRIYLLDVPGAAQTEIIAGRLADGRGGASYDRQSLLVDILDTRLSNTLRESLNLTYDVAVTLLPAREASPLTVRTVVRADGTVTALKAIAAELAALGNTNPVPADELNQMRRKSILALPGRNESPSDLIESLRTVLNFDLPDDYWNTYASRLDTITVEQLKSEAQSLLEPKQFSWVLAGDVKKFEAELRALGLAEVVLLGNDAKVQP
ncbi:M16 family metallopeptidase [Steroidobacter sp.]|uniref:M16 family metallopeptidase n=1 Tax=Steroidobacter sp. TaxID=1978227 RepID=UPI001A474156|nr:M16 family metallopeptidase [Steroidobacter sp.]MBL8267052.1 insulinase family protein [Steroidobacter sp.]